MAKKQFKSESKRLLDLMINSIYTHKEIFLRELISNSSDAIDKLYYRSLTDKTIDVDRSKFAIALEVNKGDRTIKINDNGIGMTMDDLEKNLGTIARSGSLDFKEEQEAADKLQENVDGKKKKSAKMDIDIIGQFGVGFYSAFMVSDDIKVVSKAFDSEQAYIWESTGVEGYTINACEKDSYGTEITLKIKQNTEDEKYDKYLEEYTIRQLIGKYSDYIRYPITMMVSKSRKKDGSQDEYESYLELETLNSMVPIWKKKKKDIKAEEYNDFYKEKFLDYMNPAKVIHTSVEGVTSYDALIFIPSEAPRNYYSKDYEKGLQLYSSGVLIMEKCPDLLPDYFSFIKGLVDSQDLSLNISREMLQHDRQLKAIAQRLEKKIKSELLKIQKDDREEYEKFFKNFGAQIKYGIYEDFGLHKEALQDLLMFATSLDKKMATLGEYVSRMPEEQKCIYYASGDSLNKIDKLPQTEVIKDKGFEILYLTEEIDEFTLQAMRSFEEKEFKSVSSDDLDLEKTESEKKDEEKQAEDNKELLNFIKESLGDKVTEVRLSNRLKTHPVCLTSKGDISLEMEKVINAMPTDQGIKAQRVLELNAKHPIMNAIMEEFARGDEGKEKVKIYADILYNQALLIEGMPIEDPVAFSNEVCDLISK